MIIVGQKSNNQIYGGVEKYVYELSNFLAANNYQSILLNRKGYKIIKSKSQNIKFVEIPTIHLKYLDGPVYSFLAAFYCAVVSDKIINIQGVGPAFFLPLFKILNPCKKIIFTFHCRDYFHAKWPKLGKIFLKTGEYLGCKLSDYVIAVSDNLAHYVKQTYGIMPIIVKNALDFKSIYATRNNPSLLKNFKLVKNEYFLVISRLVKHKGIETIIKQFLNQKRAFNNNKGFKLVIAGDDKYENQYKTYLKNLVASLDAKNTVIFTGGLKGDDIYTLIKYARGILNGSTYEGLSYAIIEAAAFGKPILCRNLPSNLEILGKYGYYFSDSPTSIKKSIKNFLIKYGRKYTFKRLLVKRINKYFNAAVNFKKIIELCQTLYK